MRKCLLIIFFFILSKGAYAENRVQGFNNWLLENGHTEFLEINKNYTDECRGCDDWASGECFEKNGKPKKQCILNGDQGFSETGGFKWANHRKYKNNLNIKIFTEK